MPALVLWKPLLLLLLLLPAVYIHLRGKVRHKLTRQITDHSTFTAPYNALVYLCSAVPNKPVLDRARFPELDLLRDNWRAIRDEALTLFERGHLRAADAVNDVAFNSFYKRGWKRFYFKWYSDFFPSACALCPVTVELLGRVKTVNAAMFALLPPHSRLGEHRDPFAGSVRYHLGLVTPNSDSCRIYIDGEPYSWRDGQDIVFDETFIHRAVNETEQTRIILFCDVMRPLRYRFANAINAWVVAHVVKATQTRNVPGERVGWVNHVFGAVYGLRGVFKVLKKANRRGYYAVKYAALGALIAAWLLWT